MSTGHRPTWNSAIGSGNAGGYRVGGMRAQVSKQQLKGNWSLKTRHDIPDAATTETPSLTTPAVPLITSATPTNHQITEKPETNTLLGKRRVGDRDDDEDDVAAHNADNDDEEEQVNNDSGEDEKKEDGGDGNDDDDDDDDDDDSVEDELIQQEVARIRQERALLAVAKGNPLLTASSAVTAPKRSRWNDDTVFRNQAAGDVDESAESQIGKRFINDSIRSDFHRSFMRKYIR